ncbi:MAG: fibronectin type III domain-containing protein [Candidatus Thiodiazotropha sp. (ex Myrtea sp. 'scaly one' KF741663)]|nr:fibronectin type III domain-containing protein [Candidatus Thiodiazotropha sp. (ex Myrtea sp. 'scaly one' KF741663)]
MQYALNNIIRYILLGLFFSSIATVSKSALVPDYYSEPGINPNRDYIDQNFSEYIDPFTGKLQLHYVDLYIPGNGGMDLMVQRSYTSMDDELVNQDPQSIMGFGWTVHYGRIKRSGTESCSGHDLTNTNDNPVLQLPDGKEEVFVYRRNTTLSGGYEYVSKNNWIANCSGTSFQGDNWTVKSPDGYVYEMSRKVVGDSGLYYWYTKTIKDAANNVITVNYKGDQYDLFHNYNKKPFITSVTSQGVTISFDYTNDNPATYKSMRLRTASANTQSPPQVVTYGYDQVNNSEEYRLVSVDLPGSTTETGSWGYKYIINESNLYISTPGRFSIGEVTYPKGGKINYTYLHNNFDSSDGIASTSIYTKNTSGPNINGGTWTYSYQKSTSFNDFDTTTISAPDGTYTYKHYGYDAAAPGEVWRIGLLHEKTLTGGGGTQTEIFDWTSRIISDENYTGPRDLTDQYIYAPILDRKTITRDGNSFTTDYLNFDTYGNPKTIIETGTPGNVSKTTNITYFDNITKWIIGTLKNETVVNAATVDGATISSSTIRTFFSSGNKTGKLNILNENGVISTYDYHNIGGDLYTETDSRSNTTYYRDYSRGTARDVDYPDGTGIVRAVNSTGTIQWEQNGRDITTNYTYDELNRVDSINLPSPKTDVTITRPTIQNRVVTRGNYRESAIFDGFGNVISITKQDTSIPEVNIVTTGKYDALNRLVFESYPGGSIGTRYTYDVLGRSRYIYHGATSTNTGEASKQLEYLSGNRIKITDERNNVTYHTYRAYGNPDENSLTKIEAPEGIVVDIARNKLDMVDSISIDGKVRRYYYDNNLFLKSVSDPETGSTVYTRDTVGNPVTRRVGASGDTCFRYDNLNRLEKIYFPPANCISPPVTPDIQYVYDGNGNKDKVINYVDDITRDFTYDVTDNLDLSVLTIGQQSIEFDYVINNLDQMQSLNYPSGRVVAYNPDVLGRPTSVGSYANTIKHHPNGQVKEIRYANNTITTSTLTSRQWTDVLKTTDLSSNILSGWDYNYDNLGNIDLITDLHNTVYNIDPEYDAANRLSSITGPWGGTHALNKIVYDTRGNIESKTLGSVSLSYIYNPTSERLDGISGSVSRSYQYDDYGNISSDGSRIFNYNDNSVLTSVTGSGLPVYYFYDGDKRLAKSSKDGRSTFFFYDTADKLLGEYDTSLNFQKEYVYLTNQLIATISDVPTTPPSISVSTPDGAGNHTVSWGAATGNLTHYEVVQSADPFAPEAGELVYSGSALSYSLSAPSGTYYYFVRACNGSECGDYQANSSDCAVIGVSSAPCMPASVSVPSSSGTGSYNVSWTLSEGTVTEYQIQESLQADFTAINQSYTSSTSPLIINGKGDGTYYYRVRACNGGNCSSYVEASQGVSVLIVPDAPANLVVPAQVTGSSYTVSWSGVSGIVTGYKLYEATNSSFSGEDLIYQGTALSYGVTGKTADATYYYRVVACNQAACSNPTVAGNPAIVRHAPAIPASMSVPLSNSTGDYTVTWDSTTGTVTRYELQEATNSTFTNPVMAYTGLGLSADVTAKHNGTYHYRLRACNDFACSGYSVASNPVEVTNSPYTAALIVIVTGLLLN